MFLISLAVLGLWVILHINKDDCFKAVLDLQDCCDYAIPTFPGIYFTGLAQKKKIAYFIYKLFIKWISKKYILLMLWYKINDQLKYQI